MVAKNEIVKKLVTKAALCVLAIDDINVDPSYQREVKGKHKQIVADFNEEALGVPLVGQRDDGSLWIVDGLQRMTAVKKLNWTKWRCEVFRSRGPEHEAEVFKLVNMNRQRLTAMEEYRALLTSHDETAWKLKELVESCGFSIARHNSKGKSSNPDIASRQLTCINTLYRECKYYGTGQIKFTLTCIKESWPGDMMSVYNGLVKGLCKWWRRRKDLSDPGHLIPRLQQVTPQKILYTAGQSVFTKNLADSVDDVIERLYRKRLGKRNPRNI